MRGLLVVAAVGGLLGCGGGSAPTAAEAPADPTIRVKESVGGGVGPVGGQRYREYEGPASQAPAWTKPKPAK